MWTQDLVYKIYTYIYGVNIYTASAQTLHMPKCKVQTTNLRNIRDVYIYINIYVYTSYIYTASAQTLHIPEC